MRREFKGLRVLKVSKEHRVSMGLTAMMVLTVCRDPLVRKEQREPPVRLVRQDRKAFKVCLDQPEMMAPLDRMASMELQVRRVSWVHRVPLAPMVLTERMEQMVCPVPQVRRVFRGPLVFREPLVQRGHKDLRDHRVLMVTMAPMALMEFKVRQDLKEILEQRARREPLVRRAFKVQRVRKVQMELTALMD